MIYIHINIHKPFCDKKFRQQQLIIKVICAIHWLLISAKRIKEISSTFITRGRKWQSCHFEPPCDFVYEFQDNLIESSCKIKTWLLYVI